mgnify:CR=1 FL=1
MAYDEGLAERIREVLGETPDLTEKKMFGGLAFMLGGKMFVGINQEDLTVRVGPERYEEALKEPGAREMDFTGRPMKGYVFVDAAGFEDDAELAKWVSWATEFVKTL